MGAGNISPRSEFGGVYYLDNGFLEAYRKVKRCSCCGKANGSSDDGYMTAKELEKLGMEYDFDGSKSDWAYDEDASQANVHEMISFVRNGVQARFKSFCAVDTWRNNWHIVLENELFEIAVFDNEWSAAWGLLEKFDADDTGCNRTFMRRHYQTYLEGIKRVLVDGWGEAFGYGGAWVSGKRYTREDLA